MATKPKSADAAGMHVEIPEFEPAVVLIPIVGITSLLCNRVPEHIREYLPGGNLVGTGKKPPPDHRPWEAIALDGAYRDDNSGAYVFPASGMLKALASAAYRMGLTKDIVSTYANLGIVGQWIEIEGPAPTPRQDLARNRTGDLLNANRAEFAAGWQMRFELEYNAGLFGIKKIGTIVEAAGFGVGIGCWRPERKGQHGKWKLLRELAMEDVEARS